MNVDVFKEWQETERRLKERQAAQFRVVLGLAKATELPVPKSTSSKYPAYMTAWRLECLGFTDVAACKQAADGTYLHIRYDGAEFPPPSSKKQSLKESAAVSPHWHRIIPYKLVQILITNGGPFKDPDRIKELMEKYPGMSIAEWQALPDDEQPIMHGKLVEAAYPAYVVNWQPTILGFSNIAATISKRDGHYGYIDYKGLSGTYGTGSIEEEFTSQSQFRRIVPYELVKILITNGGPIKDPDRIKELKAKYPGLSYNEWKALPK